MIYFRWIALLLIGFAAHAQDGPLDLGVRNLSGTEEAETLVSEIIAKTQPGEKLVLYHVGEKIPANLRYVVQRAAMAHIQVEILRVSQEELEQDIAEMSQAPKSFQTLLTHQTPERSWKQIIEDAKHLPNRIFGVPRMKDLSFVMKVPTDEAIRKFTKSRAILSSASTVVSMGMCYVVTYLGTHQPMEWNVALSSLAMGAWVYLTTNHFRFVNEIMTQGKALVKTPAGWKVESSQPFFWATGFMRSMMTNSIITFPRIWFEAFSAESLQRSATNSLINVFARSEIDRWIVSKTPTGHDAEGKVVPRAGEWTEKKLTNVNFIWNTVYGLIKNFNLIANDPSMDSAPAIRVAANALYGGVALINLGMMFKPRAIQAFQKVKQLWTGTFKKASIDAVACKTLLTIQEQT